MALNPPLDQVAEVEPAPARARWYAGTVDFCVRRPLGAIGAAAIVFMLAVAVLAPALAPYDPVAVDFAAMLSATKVRSLALPDRSATSPMTRRSRPPLRATTAIHASGS